MDVQSAFLEVSLQPGDILLMKDNANNFFRHAAVVTQVDLKTKHCQVAHFRGTHYPFALTEMSLPPEEVIQARNLTFHIFRLKDQALALQATELLKKWCKWAIPFDKKRFELAEKYNNDFFGIASDMFENKSPMIGDNILFNQKLMEQHKDLTQAFKEHYLDVVKYAARRDISPVRPKPENENQRGFHCLQGILIAFQVACVQTFVNAENMKWVSNKKTDLYDKASDALKPDFDLNAFLSAIPPAFQLYAKFACIDTFNYALEQDHEHILSLGILAPQTPELPYDFLQTESSKIINLYQIGAAKRKKLREEVIDPSIKIENDNSETKQKFKIT